MAKICAVAAVRTDRAGSCAGLNELRIRPAKIFTCRRALDWRSQFTGLRVRRVKRGGVRCRGEGCESDQALRGPHSIAKTPTDID